MRLPGLSRRRLDSLQVGLVTYHAVCLLLLLFALVLLPPAIEDTRILLCGECECECECPSQPPLSDLTTPPSHPSPPDSPTLGEAELGSVVEGELELFGTPILTFSYTTSSPGDKQGVSGNVSCPPESDPYTEEIARELNERLRADAIRDTIRRCQEAFRAMCQEIPAQVNMLGEAAKSASRKVVDRTFKHGEFKKWLYPGAAFGVVFAVLDEAFATLAQTAGRMVFEGECGV